MKKIALMELSSGFANLPNNLILEGDYSSSLQERPGSGYDRAVIISVPDGATIEKSLYGHILVMENGDVCYEFFFDDDNYIVSTANSGKDYYFRIVKE